MDKKTHPLILYGLPLLLAAVLKSFLWPTTITPFNADEAIVGLMARHINQGQWTPFFYGQSYMGSLDALIVALGFRLFGEQVWVIRLVQSLLYLGTVATMVMLASRLLSSTRSALIAGLLAAIPTVNVTLYSTVSLGGYGEMLLLGNLLLLGGIRMIDRLNTEQPIEPRFYWGLAVWGLGAGFAFWVMGLTLVYTIPVLAGLLWHLYQDEQAAIIKSLILLGISGLLGSAPWWIPAIMDSSLAVFSELAGGAIAGVSTGSWLSLTFRRAINFVVFGGSVVIGARPPWGVRWLMLPLLPLAMIAWLVILTYSVRKLIKEKGSTRLILVAMISVVLSAGYIFSPYGDDPSGRYFLPFLVPMSIFGGDFIAAQFEENKLIGIGLTAFLLIFNLGGIIQSVVDTPPGLTTQFDAVTQIDHSQIDELIDFLEDNDICKGYSNYWVAYPLAFLTQEEIIFVPRLPYHEDFRYTTRDDRYPPYNDVVSSATEVAYITTRHPVLDDYLREQMRNLDITWQEKKIGDYTVYYQLSESIHVRQLGLGKTTTP